MSDPLALLAERIGAVSPAWRGAVAITADAAPYVADDSGLEPGVARGVETIREGWLLHRRASRIAPDPSDALALLIGDWCYAAGLCDVTEHGTLEDVRVLAALIADVSARHDADTTELEARWIDAVEQLRTPAELNR